MAEIGRGRIDLVTEPDQLDRTIDLLARGRRMAEAEICDHCGPPAARDLQVLLHGQVAKHARDLKLAAHACTGDQMFGPVCDLGVIDPDASIRAWCLSAHQIHQGGLPGTVRTEQNAKLSVIDGERDVVDRLEAAEVHAEPVDRDRDRRHSQASLVSVTAAPDIGT